MNDLSLCMPVKPVSQKQFGMRRWVRDPADLRSASLQRLMAHLVSLMDEDGLLHRDKIEPLDLRQWWSHLLLVDVLPDHHDVRFRVIGTWVVDRVGQDDTGKTMTEVGLTPVRCLIRDSYLDAVAARRALCAEGLFYDKRNRFGGFWAERLVVPVYCPKQDCWQVLCAIYFDDHQQTRAA